MFREYLTEWDKQFSSLFDDEMQLALEDSSGEIATKQPETVKSSDDKKDDEDEEGSKSDAKDTMKDMKIGTKISKIIEGAKKKILELINKIEEFFAKKKAAKAKANWEAGYHSFIEKMKTWENTKQYDGKKKCDRYTPINVNEINDIVGSITTESKAFANQLTSNLKNASGKDIDVKGITQLNKDMEEGLKKFDDDDSIDSYEENTRKEIFLEPQSNVIITVSILDAMKNVVKSTKEWMDTLDKNTASVKELKDEYVKWTKDLESNGTDITEEIKTTLSQFNNNLGKFVRMYATMSSTVSDILDEAYVSAKTVIEFCYEEDDDDN